MGVCKVYNVNINVNFTSSHKDNVKLREDKIVPEELMLTQSIV